MNSAFTLADDHDAALAEFSSPGRGRPRKPSIYNAEVAKGQRFGVKLDPDNVNKSMNKIRSELAKAARDNNVKVKTSFVTSVKTGPFLVVTIEKDVEESPQK